MVAEQYYAVLPEGMAVWVKDRKPDSLGRMAELADDYALSRKGAVSGVESGEGRGFSVWKSESRQKGSSSNGKGGRVAGGNGIKSSFDGSGSRNGYGGSGSRSGFSGNGSMSEGGRQVVTNTRGDKKCYQCGCYGHLMYNCPSRPESKVTANTYNDGML